MRGWIACSIVAATVSLGGAARALADQAPVVASNEPSTPAVSCPSFADRWPALPSDEHFLTLEDQVTDHLTDYGNEMGQQMHHLSHDMIALRVDGRARRAYVHVGGGSAHYLTFGFDSDIHFVDGMARVKARLDLAVAGHEVHVKLPEVEMVPQSYGGDRYVELRVPLLERTW